MTSTSRTVTVPRPLATVAAYLCDFTTTAEWDPLTASCTRLDSGPLGVGARFENVQRIAGHETSLLYTVTEYEPGRRIVLEGVNKTVVSRDRIEFAQTPDGQAAVTYSVDIELQGAARAAGPLMPLALRWLANGAQESLRTHLLALTG